MRKFILGTDWWDDCDDVAAVRIIARAHKAEEICVMGIAINACMEYSVCSLEGFLNTEKVYDIPIGIDRNAIGLDGRTSYQKMLSGYSLKYNSNSDGEDAVKMYRRILAESDEKIEIIEIGFLQVIANVLVSQADEISEKSGIELIKEKVSKIWVMGGRWDKEGGKENNFSRHKRARIAANVFCDKCPVPVSFLGWEIGADVITGDILDKNDILYDVYAGHGSGEGRFSWDPMLVLMALIGDEEKAGYDVIKGTASVEVTTGRNFFEVSETGNFGYVIKKKPNENYIDMINEVIT